MRDGSFRVDFFGERRRSVEERSFWGEEMGGIYLCCVRGKFDITTYLNIGGL